MYVLAKAKTLVLIMTDSLLKSAISHTRLQTDEDEE